MLPQPGPQSEPQCPSTHQDAFDTLFTELQARLRKKASILCHNDRSPSINTGDLLSELYLRLRKNPAYAIAIAAQGECHFLAMAAKAMRNILTDAARKRKTRSSFTFITLSHVDDRKSARYSTEDLLCLDEALQVLSQSHSRRAAIIDMRFYLGLSIRELEEQWRLSDATIENEIRSAMKILHGILQPRDLEIPHEQQPAR